MTLATIVIVGAGQAGFQAAASLRQNGYDGRLVLIGEEPGLPYQRPPLSKEYLDGKIGVDLLVLRPEAFYRDQRIEFINDTVTAIDPGAQQVRLAGGAALAYDHLILATGARNRVPAIPGNDLDGVDYLRTLAETDLLRRHLDAARDVVVIGAGFIGLEFAAIATAKGARVQIVELADRAMGRALSPAAAQFFADWHRGQGVTFRFGAQTAAIQGEGGRVGGVALASGETLPADLVLVSVGIVPETSLAAAAGLAVANGIVVDAQLRTADPAISAIGDCAAYPSLHAGGRMVRLESVQNAGDHARCVADRLLGKPRDYTALPWFWSEQGKLRLQIAGLTTGFDASVIRGDIVAGEFSVFCFAGERLLGIESVNRPADHAAGRRLLAAGRSVTPEMAADVDFDLRGAARAS